MTVLHSSLFHIVRRFPQRKGIILQYFKEDENFKSICDDYRLCSEALKRWKQTESDEAHVRREEYAELLQDLELEISKILNGTV